MIDFQMINVQTVRYVRLVTGGADLVIGRGNNSHDHQGLPTQSNKCDGTHDEFSYC